MTTPIIGEQMTSSFVEKLLHEEIKHLVSFHNPDIDHREERDPNKSDE